MVGVVDDRCPFQPFEHGVFLGFSQLGTTPVGRIRCTLLALWRRTCSRRAWGMRGVWLHVCHLVPLGFCVHRPGLPGSICRLDLDLILTGHFVTRDRSRLGLVITGCCAIGSRVFEFRRGSSVFPLPLPLPLSPFLPPLGMMKDNNLTFSN